MVCVPFQDTQPYFTKTVHKNYHNFLLSKFGFVCFCFFHDFVFEKIAKTWGNWCVSHACVLLFSYYPFLPMHFASRHVGHDEVAQACATFTIIATCSFMLRSLLPHTMKSAEYTQYGGQPSPSTTAACVHEYVDQNSKVGKEMSSSLKRDVI